MFSTILSTASRYLLPLMLMFSFFLLLRGHNEPGGGFVGGLMAAAAYTLYMISNGLPAAKSLLKADPIRLIAIGLLLSLVSGLISFILGQSFLTGVWSNEVFPVINKFGTPLLFDLGVFFLVVGIALTIIFSLAEEDEE